MFSKSFAIIIAFCVWISRQSQPPSFQIIHPMCLYEPQFNQKYEKNLAGNSLRRLFQKGKHLGSGNFGEVREVQWLQDGVYRPLAIKQCILSERDDEEVLRRELDLLFQLVDNPYTVRISGCVESRIWTTPANSTPKRVLYIITERLQEDLEEKKGRESLVNTFRKKFSNERRLGVLLNIAKAVQSLHAHNVVHSDLKPGNIMSADRELSEIKLVDFGLSNIVGMNMQGSTDLFAAPSTRTPPYSTSSRLSTSTLSG
jgi:serine/threonine protein kinase